MVYWVTTDEVFLAAHNGERIIFTDAQPPPSPIPTPPSDWLQKVMRIRVLIGDPIATSIVYTDTLPESALEGSVYTTGDGVYHLYNTRRIVKLQLDDGTIQSIAGTSANIYKGASMVVSTLIARLNPLDYISSGNAGAQSVSFPSISDVIAFFNLKKQAIDALALQAGMGPRVRVKPFPVGGSYD